MIVREVLCKGKKEIVRTLIDVCAELHGNSAILGFNKPTLSMRELQIMLMTIAKESAFKDRLQIGGGPARGLCQMEPATALDTFRWLERKPELWRRLTFVWLGLRSVPFFTPTEKEIGEHLSRNDPFCLCLSRAHYKMFPAEFPRELHNQAAYWKEHWNTEAGKGTAAEAMEAWRHHRCDKLMNYALGFCNFNA